jgi:hypothetical protein
MCIGGGSPPPLPNVFGRNSCPCHLQICRLKGLKFDCCGRKIDRSGQLFDFKESSQLSFQTSFFQRDMVGIDNDCIALYGPDFVVCHDVI